jgi:hypothetical protein
MTKALLVVTAVVIGNVHSERPAPAAAAGVSPISWELVFRSLSSCGDCFQCPAGQHTAPDGGNDVDSPHSYCVGDGTCSCRDSHPPCGGTDDDVASSSEAEVVALVGAALDGDVGAARTLVQEYSDRAVLNQGRTAIQVMSACSRDAVIAHIPVDPSAH